MATELTDKTDVLYVSGYGTLTLEKSPCCDVPIFYITGFPRCSKCNKYLLPKRIRSNI